MISLGNILPREVEKNLEFGLGLAKALVGGREGVVADFLEELVGGLPGSVRGPSRNNQPVLSPAQRQSDMLDDAKQSQVNLKNLTDILDPDARVKLFKSFNKPGGAESWNQSRQDGVDAAIDMSYVAKQLKDDPRPEARALSEKLQKQAYALPDMIAETEIPYEVNRNKPPLGGNRLRETMAKGDLETADKICAKYEKSMESGHAKLREASDTFEQALKMLDKN